MIVMKFGGTSVGSADAIKRVADIIKSRLDQKPVVVVSAVGGLTDKLVELTRAACSGNHTEIDRLKNLFLDTHQKLIQDLSLSEPVLLSAFESGANMLESAVQMLEQAGEYSDELYDSLVSIGEFLSSNILAAVLQRNGIDSQMHDSRQLMITDSEFGSARPLMQESRVRVQKNLKPAAEKHVPVLQGFVGSDTAGRTTTLGRGGSDYSATLFASMLGAHTVEIWSDVDGVLSADPSLVPSAQRIRHMTFQEAAELAYFGAKVIHPSTLLPAVEDNIRVIILNSMNPEFKGTIISNTGEDRGEEDGRVKSIAYKENLTVITVISSRMLMSHGFMASLFGVFQKYRTAVDLVATSEVSVSITIDDTRHLKDIVRELEAFAAVEIETEKAVVCCVGESLKGTPGLAAQILGHLEHTKIYAISLGGSDINLSFVIEDAELPRVINRLHEQFFSK
ncbi:MAG: lysine-sensitive aspartokinase 3 [candidate division KSB1 bacterium]|nr:lysine-sensitive aspartokinase 3 [candidate division KSB1 bacterium]